MHDETEYQLVRKLHQFLLDNNLILTADASSGTPQIMLEHDHVHQGFQVYLGRRVTGNTTDRGGVWNNPGY